MSDIFEDKTAEAWHDIAELRRHMIERLNEQIDARDRTLTRRRLQIEGLNAYIRDLQQQLVEGERVIEAWQRAYSEYVDFGSRHPSTYPDPVAMAEEILREQQ